MASRGPVFGVQVQQSAPVQADRQGDARSRLIKDGRLDDAQSTLCGATAERAGQAAPMKPRGPRGDSDEEQHSHPPVHTMRRAGEAWGGRARIHEAREWM